MVQMGDERLLIKMNAKTPDKVEAVIETGQCRDKRDSFLLVPTKRKDEKRRVHSWKMD